MKPIMDGDPETRSHWHQWSPRLPKKRKQQKRRPLITVDFDHTITLNCPACPDWNGEYLIQSGTREALQRLSEDFDIVILSGGGHYIDNYKATIRRILRNNGIPYTRIDDRKPPAVFMIDDRAVRHQGWKTSLSEIERRMKR